MEEAIKKVLELLEEGKISPDEAEELIRAIRESFTKAQDKGEKEGTLKSVLKFAQWKGEAINVPYEGEFNLVLMGGDLYLKTGEGDMISGNLEGFFREAGSSFTITGGKGHLTVPENVTVNLSIWGGDAHLEGKFDKMKINVKGGDFFLDSDFNEMDLAIWGGDCSISTESLPIKVKISVLGGDFKLPEVLKKSGEHYIYGESNHRTLNVKILGGDFELKFKGV